MAFASGSLNLFLAAAAIEDSDSVNLYLSGSTSGYSYGYGSLPLYIIGKGIESNLNIYLEGKREAGSSNSSLNLSVTGYGVYHSGSMDMIVWGSSGISDSLGSGLDSLTLDELSELTLDELYDLELEGEATPVFNGYYLSNNMDIYLGGEGYYDGLEVARGSMNLYIDGPDGVASSLGMYIIGAPYESSELNIFLNGVIGASGQGLNVYLHSIGEINHTLPMFIRGYNA